MPSLQLLQALVGQLSTKRKKSLSNHYFFTRESLDEVLTPPTIAQAVLELECLPEDCINLAQTIEQDLLVTFAIVIWIHQPAAIVKFRRIGHHDSKLPLGEAEVDLIFGTGNGTIFYQEHFQFVPHFFRLDQDREIKELVILPFIREVGTIDTGSSGAVTKVEIHPSLQDFKPRPDGPVVVIRKTLRQRGSRSHRYALYQNEKRSLRLLNCLRHPNIVPLLGAYVHGQDFCFVFPLLDMDLDSFFQQTNRYGAFEHDFTFYSALHGLASALSQVHDIRLQATANDVNFSGIGYHHDFRPANILVNAKTFVLADFGMGSLKPVEQGSQTPWKAGTGDYLAPECMDDDFVHQDVGRAIDVWAFGCLIAEVATFLNGGTDALLQFRQSRLSANNQTNWETTYFYNERGFAKESVLQWTRALASNGHNSAVSQPLCRLIQDILTPVAQRPRIATVSSRLANISLKAHFLSVLDILTSFLEKPDTRSFSGTHSMKIWFERERFLAFGRVLCLYGPDSDSSELTIPEVTYEICVKTMIQMFERLRRAESAAKSREIADTFERPPEFGDGSDTSTFTGINSSEAQAILEQDIQNLTQQLWNLLPERHSNRVESIWVNSMLEIEDINMLDHLEQALGSERSRIYQEGAAMAMMKKIRLEMANGEIGASDPEKIRVPDGSISETVKRYGHQLGTYRTSNENQEVSTVIIEWMYYSANWQRIPAHERAVVMALKAEGFNVTLLPPSLRILHCLGFYEEPSRYGFVYQIPKPHTQLTTTLNRLLFQSARQAATDPYLNQPLLGDKYLLAFSLAQTVMELHSIGWLHENLHSNNVLFFSGGLESLDISPDDSNLITQPYIVGFNKSRPGGQAWHTEGPDPDAEFQSYQHPDYAVTQHFRNGYDYYSLGLVLLEIGLWTPLMGWRNNRKYLHLSSEAFRAVLVETYVPRLGPRMGKVYRDAVRMLLTDGLDPLSAKRVPDHRHEREVFKQFFDQVLCPLSILSGSSHNSGLE